MLCQLALPFERPKLHVWKYDFDLERAGTMWCADASEFHSDPKVWSTVLFGRLRPTTVHRTRPLEHCGPWHATSGQFLCEYPKQGQSPLLQRSAPHALLNSCMSAWTHQLHKRNPAAKHGWDHWHVVRDDGCSDGWQMQKVGIHATISTKECYIVHRHWVHKPQQCHHFGEALYGNYLQNLGVWDAFIQKRNVTSSIIVASTSHSSAITSEKHCMETTCRNLGVWDAFIQKRNVTSSIIVASTSHSSATTSEKHCMETTCRNLGVWDAFIQKRNVTSIVHHRCVHKPQQCHHFGEAQYGNRLQKPGCMRCLHPKAECYIVQSNCLHKPQQCHHFGEALYAQNRQKPGCMRCLHPKAECCTVQSHCLYKHSSAITSEKHCRWNPAETWVYEMPSSKSECYILHRDSFHKPQQCHHFGEALYGTYLQIPCQDIRISIGIAILVNDSISGCFKWIVSGQ